MSDGISMNNNDIQICYPLSTPLIFAQKGTFLWNFSNDTVKIYLLKQMRTSRVFHPRCSPIFAKKSTNLLLKNKKLQQIWKKTSGATS